MVWSHTWLNQLLTFYGSMTHTIPDVCVNVAKIDYKFSVWDHVFCLHVSLGT